MLPPDKDDEAEKERGTGVHGDDGPAGTDAAASDEALSEGRPGDRGDAYDPDRPGDAGEGLDDVMPLSSDMREEAPPEAGQEPAAPPPSAGLDAPTPWGAPMARREEPDIERSGTAAPPPRVEDEPEPVRDDAPAEDTAAVHGTSAEALETGAREEETAARDPASTAPPAAGQPSGRSGGGFLSSLVAAIVGGLIGAGGIWYYLDQQEPEGTDPAIAAALERQDSEVATQSERLAAIESDIGSLNEALSASDYSAAIDQLRIESEGQLAGVGEGLGRIDERLASIDAGLGSVRERLDEADARIGELEARPIADPDTATEVLRSEVESMRQEVDAATEAARAQVETMRSDLAAAAEATQAEIAAAEERAIELETEAAERARAAEEEAQALTRRTEAKAALLQIDAALDTGEPYAESLARLQTNLGEDAGVPVSLYNPADTGVPTLSELRESYPEAARQALSASAVATTEGDAGDRLMAFLRTQTQARSLAPQEGSGADAILSRAEAALDQGDVPGALAELEALPEEGRAAMESWIAEAQLRTEAVAAAESLSATFN